MTHIPPLTTRLMKPRTLLVLAFGLLTLMLTVSLAAGHQTPAQADPCPDPSTIATQADLAAKEAHCRAFIADPGINQIHTQESLGAAFEYHASHGVNPNYLWYGTAEKITVDTSAVQWTYCLERHGPSTPECEVGFGSSPVLATFGGSGGSVELDVITYGDFWVALVCGNWAALVPPDDPPLPTIPIEKYLDTDRDGQRDPGELPHANVTFEIHRISSEVGQAPGLVGTVETGANGTTAFTLDEEGPGIYEVREQVPDGFMSTTGAVTTVVVDFGIGDAALPTQVFGNATEDVDLAKVAMAIDLPDEIEARTTALVDVDVTIANHGPADHVPVVDTVALTGIATATNEIDCAVEPPRHTWSTVLRAGQQQIQTFTFAVTCDRPSDHRFTAVDVLEVDTTRPNDAKLIDTNPANDTVAVTADQPVWTDTDLASTTEVTCPERTDVDTTEECVITATVTNHGYGPIDTTTTIGLTGMADCTITNPVRTRAASLADGATEVFTETFDVACADRSFHPFVATSTITADDEHVREVDPADNQSSHEDIIEVYEPADLGVVDVDVFVSCHEYFVDDPFPCWATAVVTNDGPADQVAALVTLELSTDGCTSTPNPQVVPVIIGAGASEEVGADWDVTCADPTALHLHHLEVCVTNDPLLDPHAEDRNPANDCARVVAVPIDLKPLSDPNTLNIDRGGLTTVAILSTPTFNPMTEVDTSRPILAGPTGTEATATRCATEGEDANGDGYGQDLTCKFRIDDLGLLVDDQYLYVTGYLVDGTRFIGTDQVRVIDRSSTVA